MAATLARPIVANVVTQHLEDAASLRGVRAVLVRAPHVGLLHLGRTDERLAAHLDGLAVAGDAGARLAQAALEVPGVGQIFVAAVNALERQDAAAMKRLVALQQAVPEARRALASAFGWVSAPLLRGLTAPLIGSADPHEAWLGLAACALHRVDPGPALAAGMAHADAALRARALQAAGELGRVDLIGTCTDHLRDEDPACRLAAARAAVLLGDRGASWNTLRAMALAEGPWQRPALAMALLAASPDAARALVRELASAGAPARLMIQAAGWAGDLQVLPWLLKQMADEALARVAGESVSLLTGADLARLDLERKPPEDAPMGPSEDAADDDVALEEDESLPWPEPGLIAAWWQRQSAPPAGSRCFCGGAGDATQALQVLALGTQRQRAVAAALRCLVAPGTKLFNIAAPARRQRRWLADLGAPPAPSH